MNLLDKQDLEHLIDNVTYKPEWELKITYPDPYQGVFLSVIAKVPNAAVPDELIELRIHSPVPPMQTAAQFYTWLGWRLSMIAIHESMEFFQVAGKPYVDPHRDM